MLDPFQLPFMQRAALEVALLAPVAGLLGAQIVLRRLAFFTHGVGTAAFPGLVVAGPAGIPPALAAFAVGGGFAALLERLGRRAAIAWDAATALVLVAALAVGIILAANATTASRIRSAVAAIAAIDAVGALLVSAVLVVPAATARLFATSVAGLEAGATAIALVEGLAGLVIAFHLDAPPGAVIAVLGAGVFAAALAWRGLTSPSVAVEAGR